MKTKIIYTHINRNQGYYELTVKETEQSIIVIERTNHSGHYDKEIRYKKTDKIINDVEYLVRTDDTPWFAYHYTESYENNSYWQSWKKVF